MNILYQQEATLQSVPGTISGTGAPVGPRIEEDLAFWSGRTESTPDAYAQLQKYWSHVGYTDWTPGGTPWSASWISYQLRDQDFAGSAAHWQYVQSVIDGESPGWQAYSIPKNNGRIALQIGDVLIRPRSGSDTATHGDIVYKIQNGKAYLAGGNLSDTAKTAKTITLQNGLASIPNYQIILKKSTGGYRSWMTIAAWIGTLGLGALIWSRKK